MNSRRVLAGVAAVVALLIAAPRLVRAQTPPAPPVARAPSAPVARGELEAGVDLANRVTNKGVANVYKGGWYVGASYRITGLLSVMTAVSGDYQSRTGYTANIYEYLGGVRIQSASTRPRLRPFAQVLLGSGQDNGTGTGKTNRYPMLTSGAGVDLALGPSAAVRVRFDVPLYMSFGDTLVGSRFAIGIALPLGRR